MHRAGNETEPGVVGGRALEEDERDPATVERAQPVADESTPDTFALPIGQHPDGTQDLDVDQSPRSVQQASGEQHVPNHPPLVVFGHEREAFFENKRCPQIVEKRNHDRRVIAERQAVDLRDGVAVGRPLLTYEHGTTVTAGGPRTTSYLRRYKSPLRRFTRVHDLHLRHVPGTPQAAPVAASA